MTAHLDYLLRLGDDSLVLGQRLGEWVGHAPALEEEMALANVALDLVGQARLLLGYAGKLEGAGRSEDDIAFLRDGIDFRNCLLVEQPNGHFGDTMARQFLFDAYQAGLYSALAESADGQLAEIAAKALKETRYHLRHSRGWIVRLGDGTEESHARIQGSLDELWRFTGELFADDDVTRTMHEAGIAPLPSSLKTAWDETVDAALTEATLQRPADGWMASGGKEGRHSEHLGYLLADMQFLQRAYPGASW